MSTAGTVFKDDNEQSKYTKRVANYTGATRKRIKRFPTGLMRLCPVGYFTYLLGAQSVFPDALTGSAMALRLATGGNGCHDLRSTSTTNSGSTPPSVTL